MDQVVRATIHKGRLVIPAEWRKAYGIEDDKTVILSRTEHGIEIKTMEEVVRQAQALCAKYIKPGISLVDELRRDRDQDATFE